MKALVYLAGPVTGMPYGAINNWRDYVAALVPR